MIAASENSPEDDAGALASPSNVTGQLIEECGSQCVKTALNVAKRCHIVHTFIAGLLLPV